MAIRFFTVAVASLGLASSVFADTPPATTAPASMPATVMSSATMMPNCCSTTTSRYGMMGRMQARRTNTMMVVRPANYMVVPMQGTIVQTSGQAAAQPAPMTGGTPAPAPVAGTVVNSGSGCCGQTAAPSNCCCQTKSPRFSRISSRRCCR